MSKQDFRSTQQWADAKAVCLSLHNHQCAVCGSGSNLHAHHVLDANTNPELALSQDNLVCLCANCHSEYHNSWMGGTANPTSQESLTSYKWAARVDNALAWMLLFAAIAWGVSHVI